jgi:hypothetical protein
MTGVRVRLLIIILFLLSFSLNANECKNTDVKEIDMRDQMGPLRDQDSIGWCYAHAAADLMNHHLYKSSQDPKYLTKEGMVSANSVAINYNTAYKSRYYRPFKDWSSEDFAKHNRNVKESIAVEKKFRLWEIFENPFKPKIDVHKKYEVVAEGGHISAAIYASSRLGHCSEGEMPSDDFNLVFGSSGCDTKESGGCEFANLLKAIYDFNQDGQGTESWCKAEEAITNLFPSLSTDVVPKIMLASHRQNIIENLKKASCDSKNKTPKILDHFIDVDRACRQKIDKLCNYAASNEHLFEKMDLALEQGKIVGISYNSEFLNSDKNEHKNSYHASSIVGKRLNPQSCEIEYILRNSWGKSCNTYKKMSNTFMGCLDKLPYDHSTYNGLLEELNDAPPEQKGFYQRWIQEVDETVKNHGGFVSKEKREKLKKECEHRHPMEMNNPKLSCENGYLIVPKSELKNNLFGVTYY